MVSSFVIVWIAELTRVKKLVELIQLLYFRRTDRQTRDDSTCRASIESRGKNT